MRFLRNNTACRVTVGPFLDKTDGVTPEVALTVTGIKLTFMVDTGDVPTLVLDTNPTASGGSNDMVHVTNDDAGFYDLELTAANVNYFGRAMLALTDAANHCPVFHEFMILPANVYDALVLGSDRLDIAVAELAASIIADSAVAADMDTYSAKIWVIKEGTSSDHYAVRWFKNGVPITSGITSPTIQIIKGSDGTDLIASTALTEIGSTHRFKKDESTNKLVGGQIYFAVVSATIDGSTRTYDQQVGRDSA